MTEGASRSGAAVAAAHARLLADGRFQFDFPVWKPPAAAPPPAWLKALLQVAQAVLPYLFWGIVLAGGVWLAALLVQAALRSREGRTPAAVVLAGGEPVLPAGRAKARLEQADRLAAEGRFGEAVRVLLFRTLDDIEERRPGLIRASLTSREIGRLEALPEPARPALARIAAAVERVVFAGRDADGDVFRACREDYVRFAGAAG